jgi:ATP-binding cassette subfamily C protein
MIAPEYFAPFRRFAEQYHAKAEGEAAGVALDALLDAPAPARPQIAAIEQICSTSELPRQGLVALTGPSGSGKSTLLRRLTGLETGTGAAKSPLACKDLVWIATDSFIAEGTLAAAITWNVGSPCPTRLASAAGRLGLLDDTLLPGGLDAPVAANGANLSGGQRLRIAVARALVSSGIVIADEPTAKLDARAAMLVRRALVGLAKTRLVLVATHDHDLEHVADVTIRLDTPDDHNLAEVAA